MNILVLNGSPKGELSVTLQYCRFIAQNDPENTWQYCHGAREVKKMAEQGETWGSLLEQLAWADILVWSFPVYYMSIPGQYKRFIDLLYQPEVQSLVRGKAAALLTTSIHFYDHTAQATMRAICQDLGLRLLGGYSAHMADLRKGEERQRLLANWAEWLRRNREGGAPYPEFMPWNSPLDLSDSLSGKGSRVIQRGEGDVVVVGDLAGNANLQAMVRVLMESMGERVRLIDLAEADIRQGCLGCCRCGMENICVQDQSDGFRELLDGDVLGARTVIFALDLNHRLFSWRLKQFWDRSFCHNHVPFYKGRKLGWLVSGPLSANAHILDMMHGFEQLMECQPIGIVGDEWGADALLSQLNSLIAEEKEAFDFAKIPPRLFTGLAGKLIFRDAVFGTMRLVFPMDHRYYRRNGYYDFPTRRWGDRLLVWLAAPLLKIPFIRKGLQKNMITGMVRPYQKMLMKWARKNH